MAKTFQFGYAVCEDVSSFVEETQLSTKNKWKMGKWYERLMERTLILVLSSVIVRICASLGSYYCTRTTWYKMSTFFASIYGTSTETPYAKCTWCLFATSICSCKMSWSKFPYESESLLLKVLSGKLATSPYLLTVLTIPSVSQILASETVKKRTSNSPCIAQTVWV